MINTVRKRQDAWADPTAFLEYSSGPLLRPTNCLTEVTPGTDSELGSCPQAVAWASGRKRGLCVYMHKCQCVFGVCSHSQLISVTY